MDLSGAVLQGRALGLDPRPLLELVGRSSDARVADRLGVSSRTVLRWRHGRHKLTLKTADEAAIRLGLHPALIWGEAYLGRYA